MKKTRAAKTLDDLLIDGPADAAHTFVFAHGAGGAMDTPFMTRVARALGGLGINVVRFEFPYMSARRKGERREAPDREPILLDSWRSVVTALGGGSRVVIGGKSMGGRMATMVADELAVRGVVCLGYPFHPPGRPDRLRTAHLEKLMSPALIIQGTRDAFGSREDLDGYRLSPAIRVEWLEDGDHSFRPRARSGATEAEHIDRAVQLCASFIESTKT